MTGQYALVVEAEITWATFERVVGFFELAGVLRRLAMVVDLSLVPNDRLQRLQ